MAFGLELRDSANRIFWDLQAVGGIFVELFTAPGGASSSKTYTQPELNGKTLFFFYANVTNHTFSASLDGSGNPVLTYTTRSGYPTAGNASTIGVFAK